MKRNGCGGVVQGIYSELCPLKHFTENNSPFPEKYEEQGIGGERDWWWGEKGEKGMERGKEKEL